MLYQIVLPVASILGGIYVASLKFQRGSLEIVYKVMQRPVGHDQRAYSTDVLRSPNGKMITHITVLHCCKGDSPCQWNTPIRRYADVYVQCVDPQKSETPEPIDVKLDRDDYDGDLTPRANFRIFYH